MRLRLVSQAADKLTKLYLVNIICFALLKDKRQPAQTGRLVIFAGAIKVEWGAVCNSTNVFPMIKPAI